MDEDDAVLVEAVPEDVRRLSNREKLAVLEDGSAAFTRRRCCGILSACPSIASIISSRFMVSYSSNA